MPTALSDPSPTLYLVLVVVTVVTGALWVRNRSRSSLVNFGIAAGVLALLFLIDWTFESPREQAVRRIEDVSAAINARDFDRMLTHFSETFNYNGRTKADLRTAPLRDIVTRENVRTSVWDFTRDQVEYPNPNEIVVGFMGRGEGNMPPFAAYFRVTFVSESNGDWKIKTFLAYQDPLRRANQPPITVPGF
jgi:hypothetical protein